MAFIDEIKSITENSINDLKKQFCESKEFKREIDYLMNKIKEAAGKGKFFVHDVIKTYCTPYNNSSLKFEIVKDFFEKQGFRVVQMRCNDGFPMADHYDICWK